MIEIRRADLITQRELLIRLLREHLTPRSDEQRYDWFYRACPYGEARAWVAIDTKSGEVVGSAAIVPQRLRAGRVRLAACIMADFWVHPNHRVLGPAVRLQRACIEGAREAGMQIFIDLPQGAMPAVYSRLGITPTSRLVRHTRPLRADAYVRRLPLPTWLQRSVAVAVNAVLPLTDPKASGHDSLVADEESDGFGPEYDALADRVSDSFPLCIARSSEYLSWRYTNHYHLKHHVVVARRSAQIEGYAVIAIEKGVAQIVDLFGAMHEGTQRTLVAASVRVARARGAAMINLPLLEHDASAAFTAGSSGFRARESMPVIVHALDKSAESFVELPYFAYGDLDY